MWSTLDMKVYWNVIKPHQIPKWDTAGCVTPRGTAGCASCVLNPLGGGEPWDSLSLWLKKIIYLAFGVWLHIGIENNLKFNNSLSLNLFDFICAYDDYDDLITSRVRFKSVPRTSRSTARFGVLCGFKMSSAENSPNEVRHVGSDYKFL